jgi:hypothetical protein
MPSRKQLLSITLASAAFVAMAVAAANLHDLETTKVDQRESLASATAVAGVTVSWLTDYDPLLGGEKVVGATLEARDGSILANSEVELTIVDADGSDLGTITSTDGGQSWSELDEAVPVGDSLAASVVINDRVTVSAVSPQH